MSFRYAASPRSATVCVIKMKSLSSSEPVQSSMRLKALHLYALVPGPFRGISHPTEPPVDATAKPFLHEWENCPRGLDPAHSSTFNQATPASIRVSSCADDVARSFAFGLSECPIIFILSWIRIRCHLCTLLPEPCSRLFRV